MMIYKIQIIDYQLINIINKILFGLKSSNYLIITLIFKLLVYLKYINT
jgi:hypothetical protein